jgi:uncharacterized membrane protein HdeD (DUF308 family)
MLDLLARNWWLLAIRGVAAILFGLACFFWPGVTLLVLVSFFGAYALIDGISLLFALIRGDATARRHAWSVGVMGVLGIAAGLVTFFAPGLTAISLALVVGVWAVILGALQVAAAVALRREIHGEFWMALAGLAAILFGLYIIVLPGDGLISLLWLLGSWALVFGVLTLGLAFRLRGHPRTAVGMMSA